MLHVCDFIEVMVDHAAGQVNRDDSIMEKYMSISEIAFTFFYVYGRISMALTPLSNF